MISYNELKKGKKIILDKQPYEIIEASLLFKGRGHSVCQAQLKNLITGNVVSRTFHPSDNFEQAEISELKAKFVYSHSIRKPSAFHPVRQNLSNGASRDKYIFSESDNPSKRFELGTEQIGDIAPFLKPNQTVQAFIFDKKIINISLPIKIQLKVKESPPGVQGGRSQPGNKLITLETGAQINTPLFIETGDIIEINTETKEYVRRVK